MSLHGEEIQGNGDRNLCTDGDYFSTFTNFRTFQTAKTSPMLSKINFQSAILSDLIDYAKRVVVILEVLNTT